MSATITPAELYAEITAGQVPHILDVRNEDEFAAAADECSRPVPTRNVPVWRVMDALDELAAQAPDGAVIIRGPAGASSVAPAQFAPLRVDTASLRPAMGAGAPFRPPAAPHGAPLPP